ncbi:MAG: hypothetical protein KGP28_10790, partial [Bdellovibrionales bacterium]|nr:hypothetical protein [Bdellovibrionales bacterium]
FVFAPGSTSASITLTPVNNSVSNDLKNVILSLQRSNNSPFDFVSNENRAQILIRDEDGPVRMGFAPILPGLIANSGTNLALSFSESSGNIQIPVMLSKPAASSVSASVTLVANSSAVSGTDFVLMTQQVSIQPGQVRSTVSFSLIDNLNFKGNRGFAIVLGNPNGGASLAGIIRVDVGITDNESAPSIQFENSGIVRNEDSGEVTIPVSLSSLSVANISINGSIGSDSGGTVLLGDAIRGEDFNVISASSSIPAGSVQGFFRINLINDTLNEDNESVVALLNNGSAAGGASINVVGRSRSTVEIRDNDPNPVVQWTSSSQTVAESSGKARIVASIGQVAGKNVRVPFRISGSAELEVHHNLTPSELIIPKGQSEGVLEVPLVLDSRTEPNQTLIVTLTGDGNAALGSSSVHTLTITDESGFTPSLAAFQSTVWTYVRSQQCYTCHKPGAPAEFAPFASDNAQDAFNAAVTRTNFTNIPQSLLATKLGSGTHQQFSSLAPVMITQITNWLNQSGGAGGSNSGGSTGGGSSAGGGSDLAGNGSVGIQDFLQVEAALSSATEIPIPALNFPGTYHILRANISSDGDPTGISAPMAGAYIGVGAHYCKAMIDEVSGSSTNKRGFDRISGLNNFNATAANFNQTMQTEVIQKFAEMFWQRQATPAEVSEILSLVGDLRTSGPSLTTKVLGTAMCSAISGSVEAIDN